VDEVAWWLMQFADGITVLRPPELRDRVVAMARRLLEVHDSPPGQ